MSYTHPEIFKSERFTEARRRKIHDLVDVAQIADNENASLWTKNYESLITNLKPKFANLSATDKAILARFSI